MVSPIQFERLAVVEQRLDNHDRIHRDMHDTLNSIAQSLKDIVRIEERQLNARIDIDNSFVEIRKLNDRVSEIEKVLPDLKTVKYLVFAGITAIFTGLADLLFLRPH